jgi:NAD(P)-dependent dehydrogenase (short-subunit alcohol dehydrogenase family)
MASFDNTESLELVDRIAHRCAAYTEALREILLVESLPRTKHSLASAVEELEHNPVRQLTVDRCRRQIRHSGKNIQRHLVDEYTMWILASRSNKGGDLRSAWERVGMIQELERQVAVITGGSSGIGRATCLRMARERCRVAIIDVDEAGARRVAGECTSRGTTAMAIRADVSVEGDIEAAISQVLARFGRVDVLVSNAGIEGRMCDVADLTAAEWDRLMAVNVRGAFLTVRSCLPSMRAQHSGAIVLTASNYGLVATPHTTAYCTSKGAVAALGRALAVELAPDGIRVNCVCPGNVDTPMFDRALAMQFDSPARVKAEMGRMATADEIANVIVFLASREASYMTGAHVVVDFGETSRPGPVWPSPHW